MIQVRSLSLMLSGAALLLAAEPDWKSKPIADWTEQDAQQILGDSPWAKIVVAGTARRRSEDELREGGQMGQPHGVGYDGVEDKKRSLEEAIGNPFIVGKTPPPRAQTIRLLVRWESALPIRAAEFKARESEPPTVSENGYTIAVWGVPPNM